jgi:hypothetical protein
VLLLAVVPAWNHPYFEELKSPNPLSRTYLTRALWDHGTVSINKVEQELGEVMDRAVRAGRAYCDKAPGSSFLLVPVYAALKVASPGGKVSTQRLLAWGSLFLGVVPTALALLCLEALMVLLGVAWRARRVALMAYGLGSVGVPFELLFFGHQLAACLVVFTLWATVTAAVRHRGELAVLAGFCAGWAAITEYPTTLLVAMVVAWGGGIVIRNGFRVGPRLVKLLGLATLGAVVPLGLGMAYHQAAFGGPLTTGYAFIQNAFFASIHHKGLMGVSLPTWDGLGGTLFSAARGLFYFSPYLLLWPVGAWVLARRGRLLEGVVILVTGLLYAAFAAGFGYWQGGWSLGPRHLVPAVPVMLLGFAVALGAWERSGTPWVRLVASGWRGAVAWGVVVVGLACVTHSGYPEELAHPFFQMTLPLLVDGRFPHSVGTFLGLGGWWSAAVPLAALVVTVFSVAWVGLSPRRGPDLWRVAATGATAALLVVALGSLVRFTPEASHRLAWIMDTVWEPRAPGDVKRPDPVKQAPGFGSRPVRQDERNHVGRHHARTGDPARAMEEYVRGAVAESAGRP